MLSPCLPFSLPDWDILLHTLAVSVVLFWSCLREIYPLSRQKVPQDSSRGCTTSNHAVQVARVFQNDPALGLFIGTLLSLGRLYAESEMVVLRACGVGPGKLAITPWCQR